MSDMDSPAGPNRREALGTLAAAAAGVGLDWSSLGLDDPRRVQARKHAANAITTEAAGQVYEPEFFEPNEWTALRMLVDIIIPADDRSGGATDAGVPAYIDYLMISGDDAQRDAVRGGFAWLDRESTKRFDAVFVGTTDANREAIVTDIAWPDRAPESLSHGVAFFTRMRDLTASGFWSSRMGVDDLEYTGNTMIPAWYGCPDEQLEQLGVTRARPADGNRDDNRDTEQEDE